MTYNLTRFISPLRAGLGATAVAVALAIAGTPADRAFAAGGAVDVEKQDWTFAGPFGFYDQDQLRRGFQVYKQVCSSCHGMNLLYYRNLTDESGPNLPQEQVEAIAADYTVTDGPNDQGEMFERPATPNDSFVDPYRNDKEAALVNNGVVPPDLSVIAKARNVSPDVAWYMSPVAIAQDLVTMYAEGGPDYIYAFLTGYEQPPEDFNLPAGSHYNRVYPGNAVAMPQVLYPDIVQYNDGTPTTEEQYAKDVTAFLMWTAEPKLEERKQMGAKVMLYLFILAALLYMSKRILWKRLKH
jgi:cytochrome c1